jgi:flagellar assembly protein FliH
MTLTVPLPAPLRAVTLRKDAAPVTPAESPTDAALAAAYERGVRDGENRLRDQLLAQRQDFLEHQRGVLAALQQAVPEVRRAAEQHLIAMALEAAQRVVAGLPVSAELVTATVREALAQVEETARVVVALPPADLALLTPAEWPGIEFRADPSLARGDCLVQTPFGVVDARRETKWANLREAVLT